jgi:hypothetical protein
MKNSAGVKNRDVLKQGNCSDSGIPQSLVLDTRRFASFAGGLRCAFSLVEVIIAVGIFAAAVAVILALLPALTRQAGISADTLTALRLPDATRAELQRVASIGGFDTLAGKTRPQASPLPETLTLVASRDAARVQTLNYQPPMAVDRLGEAEQFFLIEIWSFPDAPLAFDSGGAGLALFVRVSWPYRNPGSVAAIASAEHEQVTFTLAIRR